MNLKFSIRDERPGDIASIAYITEEAFKTLEISNHTEQFVINALRAGEALTISLVAELEGSVIGHIAFSPVIVSDGTSEWFGLGPVSVLPEYQGQGVGKVLIESGLYRLNDFNAKGCCLVGHPEYYKKFGFKNVGDLVYKAVPREFFFVLPFNGDTPLGEVTFHDAFNATDMS